MNLEKVSIKRVIEGVVREIWCSRHPEELFNPGKRCCKYPFINANRSPRFTTTENLPYDAESSLAQAVVAQELAKCV